jgi:3-hydroxymyristoyl/3-hydroxydecanoyl-(acyl carrier protein) dehydratase
MSFLFIDRMFAFVPGKSCTGLKHITYDDTYLVYNEKNQLCFSPAIIGEALGQLAAWNAMFSVDFKMRPVAGVVDSVCLHRNILVGETVVFNAVIDSIDETAIQYHGNATIGDEEVFTLSSALGPMLPMQDFIDQDLAKKQFDTIYRPIDYATNQELLNCDVTDLIDTSKVNITSLTYDKIIANDPGQNLVASKKIMRSAPYFDDHFPNKPVLPLTVLLACKINLAQEFIARAGYKDKYRVKSVRKIKMNDFVQPGDEVISSIRVKHYYEDELILQYRSEVGGKRVCILEIKMVPTRNI